MKNLYGIISNFDNSIILAIVAINMTVIGLTSLADTKSVIGIDYGDFLIKKYKIGYKIRMFYLLILFAITNIISLFSIIITNENLLLINSINLLVSLIFAIYYFFSYILVENDKVKHQIYENELTGLFYKDNNTDHFEVDMLVKIPAGNKTGKRLSTSVINHFNKDTELTLNDFERCFGIEASVYNYSKVAKKKFKADYGYVPYEYRKSKLGVYDISHEFFRLFRNTELQHKWGLDILELCNNFPELNGKFDKIKIYNLTRVMTHINTFGFSEGLYKYKFLEYLLRHINDVFALKGVSVDEEEKLHLIEVEKYFYKQLYQFLGVTITQKNNNDFINKSNEILKKIILEKELGFTSIEDKLNLLIAVFYKNDSPTLRNIINNLFNEGVEMNKLENKYIEEAKSLIVSMREEKSRKNNRIDIFEN